MPKPRVFVTRAIAQEALDKLGREVEIDLWPQETPPPHQVLLQKVSQGVDGLLTMLTDRVDAQLLDTGLRLKVVSNMAVGCDNIHLAEATRRGIPIGNTPGVLTHSTADLAFALLLATARRIVESDKAVRQGQWKTWHPLAFLGNDVHGATLGIVGLGRIGLEVAKRALGFEMHVLYYNRSRKLEEEQRYGLRYVDLPTLLQSSDFVTLHVPLTSETRHLVGTKELAQMKPTAHLINASRGPVVDQRALYEALRGGVIAGAALDVTVVEPIPMDDPLLTLPNCIILPHIGSATHATRTKMALMAVENLLAGLKGERLPHCANPEVYELGRKARPET